MSTKQIDIPDFCAHVADELRAVEHGNAIVALTRDGQIIAYLSPAPKPNSSTGTFADWSGTGSGYTLAQGSSLDDPSWTPEEWEEFPAAEPMMPFPAS